MYIMVNRSVEIPRGKLKFHINTITRQYSIYEIDDYTVKLIKLLSIEYNTHLDNIAELLDFKDLLHKEQIKCIEELIRGEANHAHITDV